MFGNDRELKEKTRLLDKAFFHWAKIIIALDPAIRKLQIDDYKDYIARYENDHGDFSMMRTEPKEAVKDLRIENYFITSIIIVVPLKPFF